MRYTLALPCDLKKAENGAKVILMKDFNFKCVDPSWLPLVKKSLLAMNQAYLCQLKADQNWLPGPDKIFNAFSSPIHQIKFILFGESPYPRQISANGYAFWDTAVDGLWSPSGLSKTVNRATSLRNIIKMLLIAAGLIKATNLSQPAIAKLNKTHLVQSIDELFINFIHSGFMLLNTSLVLHQKNKIKDAKAWQAFMSVLLSELAIIRKDIQLVLFGNIAKQIMAIPSANQFKQFFAEHPYNLSFVTNPKVIEFFKPFHMLERKLVYD